MMTVITTLLNDEDFEKSKNLCQMLTSITLVKNPQLAKLILNHTSTIMRDDFWDVELSLRFYKQRATDIQYVGDSGKKRKLKLINELVRATKREDELSRMLQMLLEELSSEDRKISFSNFPQILTSIQVNHEFCESIYEKLVKVTPCTKTYNAYAKYLIRFLNDKKTANLYIKEAKQLAFTQSNRSEYSALSDATMNREFEQEKPKEVSSIVAVSTVSYHSSHTIEEEEEPQEYSSSSTHQEFSSCNYADEDENGTDEHDIDDLTDTATASSIEDDDGLKSHFSRGNSDVVRMVNEHGIDLKKEDLELKSIDEKESSKLTPEDCPEEDNGSITSQSNEKTLSVRTQPIMHTSRQEDSWTDDKLSYRRKDSIITKETTSSMGSDIRTHLSKKVSGGTYCSTWLIRGLCIAVFLAGIAVVILVFTMSFVLRDDFKTSGEMVVLGAKIQKSMTEISHFTRKLQVSHYSPEETPFDYERDRDLFGELVKDHCGKSLERSREIYSGMNEGQREPWTDEDLHVDLVNHVTELHEDARDHVYTKRSFSLIDAVSVLKKYVAKDLQDGDLHKFCFVDGFEDFKIPHKAGEIKKEFEGVKDPLEGKQPYHFQHVIIKKVTTEEANDRDIIWVRGAGDDGKSAVQKHLKMRYNACSVSGNARDAKRAIVVHKKIYGHWPSIVLINIPKEKGNRIDYAGLEDIKDGDFVSTKYEIVVAIFNSPHVVVFSNEEVEKGKWTYGEKCYQFYNEHEEILERYGTENYTLGNRIQDNEAFIFVTLNEEPIHHGLEYLLEHLILYEESDSQQKELIYILIPCLLCLFFPIACCVYCTYSYQQRKTFKGFLIIPKEKKKKLKVGVKKQLLKKNTKIKNGLRMI